MFELLDDIGIESAKKVIGEAKYQLGEIEEVSPNENVVLGNEGNYDLLIIGSGGAAFRLPLKRLNTGRKLP